MYILVEIVGTSQTLRGGGLSIREVHVGIHVRHVYAENIALATVYFFAILRQSILNVKKHYNWIVHICDYKTSNYIKSINDILDISTYVLSDLSQYAKEDYSVCLHITLYQIY